MIGIEIDAWNGEDLVRFVRTLGQHRYVAGRLHLVHAFALEAAGESPALTEARAWAASVLADPDVDRASKDERLFRKATDAELVAVLASFWTPESGSPKERLAARLDEIGADRTTRLPFDEAVEEDMFPVLVDAGWELLGLTALDPDRHKGALGAFDDFEIARFEEESATPPVVTLNELPALGAVELLEPFDDFGEPRAPFVLWTSGNETYVDYVLRGVLRAAKLVR